MNSPLLVTILPAVFAVASSVYAQSDRDLGSISDYSLAGEVWLSSIVGEVTVNPEFPIKASALGKLEWLVADGTEVMEDNLVCYTGADKIKLSERDLTLRKSRYPNALNDLEWSYIEQRKSVETSIIETGQKLSEMTLTPTELDLLGNEFEKRLKEEKDSLEKDLKRLKFKLESGYFTQGLEDEKTSLNLEIDMAEQSHQELLRNSEVRVTEEGILRRNREDVIKSDTVIGSVTKTGVAEAILEISDPSLRNVPPSRLSISIQGDNGKNYQGEYLRTLEAQTYQRNTLSYVFIIRPHEGEDEVPDSLNGTRLFRVSMILDKPGHIVPKGDLLFRFPKEIDEGGWALFVSKRWNGATILHIGPRDLVVVKNDEN